jgi:small neutral amino acid transporter SnatA (MarC family)
VASSDSVPLRAHLEFVEALPPELGNRPKSRVIIGQSDALSAMDDATLKFGLTAFATLLVVVDPFGVLPIFFSLAIPLLAGPGTITSILLLTAQARGRLAMLAMIVAALGLVFLITRFVIGFGAERLMRLLRPGGLHVVTRVLGILLAALAVRFVLNGISEFVRLLESSRG